MGMAQVEHKGRWITVHTNHNGKAWSWSYQIDGGPIRTSGDRPLPSEELVAQEAVDHATREIDRAIQLGKQP